MPGVPWAPLPKTCPPAARASSPIQASQTRPHRSREPGGQRASPAVTCSPAGLRASPLPAPGPGQRPQPVECPPWGVPSLAMSKAPAAGGQ